MNAARTSQIIFGILFLVTLGYERVDNSVLILLWRNLCAATVFLIFLNKISSHFETDLFLVRIEADSSYLKFFFDSINIFKLFFATVFIFAIPLFFLAGPQNESLFFFVMICVLSTVLITTFVILNHLIARRFEKFISPNRSIIFLTLLPLVASIMAVGFDFDFLVYLFLPNLNAFVGSSFKVWNLFLPIPYTLLQVYLGLYHRVTL
ncbi:MAG: hypothetical protein KF725_00280 [Cyclobacteriaceae bacterium]|nr:hypothetical protein [Cyclobacteriaceae bacterium]UYN87096.1 MAG: hypothetical protein KIT51_02125 [Cyclobacteriaceae bacterium]